MIKIKSIKPTHFFLVALVLLATFLRFYNINQNVEFLGDQGRDAMVVARIFTHLDPVFIGPVTSVGNMYLGPFYYYLMLPFLWLTYPSPMGPVYMVAGLGVISVYLIYKLGKELVGAKASIIASIFFAFSATVVQYSRFSWNPNPAPFFSIIMIWATFKAWQKDKRYWILATLCFSILVQLHYVYLLSAGGIGIIWLIQLIELIKKTKSQKQESIKQIQKLFISTIISGFLFLASTLPLMLFDYKHQFLNLKALSSMFFSGENFVQTEESSRNIFQVIMETHGRSMHILFEYVIGQQRLLNTILVLITLFTLAFLIFFNKKYQYKKGLVVISSYLVIGIIGTAFYQHTVFVHYIAYLFPITFLIYGVFFDWLTSKKIGYLFLLSFVILFLNYNLAHMPLKDRGWGIQDVQRTADSIYQHLSPGEKYNIVLLSESGDIDGQSYRYFLTTTDIPPVETAQRGEVETLFIINEDQKIDKVTDSPIYEIVVFPDKDNFETYQVENGPEITILRKTN